MCICRHVLAFVSTHAYPCLDVGSCNKEPSPKYACLCQLFGSWESCSMNVKTIATIPYASFYTLPSASTAFKGLVALDV